MNIYTRQFSKLLLGLLAVAAFCKAVPPSLFFDAGKSIEPIAEASIVQNHHHTDPTSKSVTRPIEQIRVGHRVMAHNPNVSESERAQWDEPEWSTWKFARLEMEKHDGSILNIDLIRPESWFNFHKVASEKNIQLDLPEMGAQGAAHVVAVGECPPIESGNGRVVTATFAHPPSTTVLDVTFQAITSTVDTRDESIGVTDNHLFWSADRLKFLPIGEMEIGERVQTYFGDTKRLASKLPRPGPDVVYNIEVHNEHVYFVGHDSVLAHNTCPDFAFRSLNDDDIETILNHNGIIRSGRTGHSAMVDTIRSNARDTAFVPVSESMKIAQFDTNNFIKFRPGALPTGTYISQSELLKNNQLMRDLGDKARYVEQQSHGIVVREIPMDAIDMIVELNRFAAWRWWQVLFTTVTLP